MRRSTQRYLGSHGHHVDTRYWNPKQSQAVLHGTYPAWHCTMSTGDSSQASPRINRELERADSGDISTSTCRLYPTSSSSKTSVAKETSSDSGPDVDLRCQVKRFFLSLHYFALICVTLAFGTLGLLVLGYEIYQLAIGKVSKIS